MPLVWIDNNDEMVCKNWVTPESETRLKKWLDNEPCMENVASAMTEVVVEDVDGGKRV